jgi:hypothetical protein
MDIRTGAKGGSGKGSGGRALVRWVTMGDGEDAFHPANAQRRHGRQGPDYLGAFIFSHLPVSSTGSPSYGRTIVNLLVP